jgi:hypothetical protein
VNSELKLWFDNLKNRKQNNKILFFDDVSRNEFINIKNKYYNNSKIQGFLKIFFLDKLSGQLRIIEGSSIVYLKVDNHFLPDTFFIKDIIYIKSNKELINLLEDIIVNISNKINLENFEYSYIGKINIESIIENKEELLDKIRERTELLKSIMGEEFVFNKIENTQSGYQDTKLIEYINILKNKNILIASLGHYLYKIFTLDFHSTTTKVGLNISKDLNSKSKTFTYQFLTGKKTNNHNLKAYDLNINQIELDTKIRIAKNLLTLKEGKFDNKTIAKITELSENEVFKLFMKIQFSNFK